jgi:hypothetical protein
MVWKQCQLRSPEFNPKIIFQNSRIKLFSLFSDLHENKETWWGLKPFEWEAHALGPAGVVCERASTDENHADEF